MSELTEPGKDIERVVESKKTGSVLCRLIMWSRKGEAHEFDWTCKPSVAPSSDGAVRLLGGGSKSLRSLVKDSILDHSHILDAPPREI